jgi:hypothetical protein
MHWLDPDHLPETTGTLGRFLLNPHGETGGMIGASDAVFPTAVAAISLGIVGVAGFTRGGRCQHHFSVGWEGGNKRFSSLAVAMPLAMAS